MSGLAEVIPLHQAVSMVLPPEPSSRAPRSRFTVRAGLRRPVVRVAEAPSSPLLRGFVAVSEDERGIRDVVGEVRPTPEAAWVDAEDFGRAFSRESFAVMGLVAVDW